MRHKAFYIFITLAVCATGVGLWKINDARASVARVDYLTTWSPKAAADYLDRREVWWQGWPLARMDHGTICVSCHTVVPYAMTRYSLGVQLHETAMPVPQKILMDNVERRVRDWSTMVPFYSDAADGPGKTAESHATEAVLNAVILMSYDRQHGHLRPITRAALGDAWALQEDTGDDAGGWKWQDFHLAPWESAESGYQGAALLMLEIENAPDGYSSEQQIHENLLRLQQYLRKHYAAQPLVNQLYILWLSSKVPALLTSSERGTLLDAIDSRQQHDGGWSLFSLDPRSGMENDHLKRLKLQLKEHVSAIMNPSVSDGYATGLVAMALEELGTEQMTRGDQSLKRALEWLEKHQGSDGSWLATSLNEPRDPQSDIGRFMTDAATAYAVMALENGPTRQPAGK